MVRLTFAELSLGRDGNKKRLKEGGGRKKERKRERKIDRKRECVCMCVCLCVC